MTIPITDDLVHRLRGLAEAYPEDVFPDFTKQFSAEERKKHQILITLVSASMGRHFGKLFTKAADTIESLQRSQRECVGLLRELHDYLRII